MSDLEAAFDTWLRRLAPDLPPPVAEHRFHAQRKWRFDRAWPAQKIAVELEGGTWSGGRHTTGAGYERDCEKYNAATIEGWRVLRVTTTMLDRDPAAIIDAVIELHAQHTPRSS